MLIKHRAGLSAIRRGRDDSFHWTGDVALRVSSWPLTCVVSTHSLIFWWIVIELRGFR